MDEGFSAESSQALGALRAAAELIAGGASVNEVLATVAEFAAEFVGASYVAVLRLVASSEIVVEAAWTRPGAPVVVLDRWLLEDDAVTLRLVQVGVPIRETWDGITGPVAVHLHERLAVRSSVGAPIRVGDRTWGALYVHSTGSEFPDMTEACLEACGQLIAAAIASAATRVELERVALEQRALRRVAELVAHSAAPFAVFDAVAEELGRLIRVQGAKLLRYETDGTATFVASWGALEGGIPTGTRLPVQGTSVTGRIFSTGIPSRVDDFWKERGVLAERLRAGGILSAVGAPIWVEGRLWGALTVCSADAAFPSETEERMSGFAELVATAIGSLESRRALLDSRTRLIHTADETRRRLERDLHDGVQQRLVAVGLGILEAREAGGASSPAGNILSSAATLLDETIDELRELSHGVHPAILTEGGLGPALRALARRSGISTDLHVADLGRLDERVEIAAYFVIAEGLSNTAKHASDARATVRVDIDGEWLTIIISDDGGGGADPSLGTGLIGILDRVEMLSGSMKISSPRRKGTRLEVLIPVRGHAPRRRNELRS